MFPVTQWTDLAKATLHGDEAGRAALESLCRTYWEPVRQAVLMKGWHRDEAADLVQSFFLYFMEQGILNRADRERGRFRSFIQGVLNNWLLTERDRRLRQKRGGGQKAESLEELPEPASNEDGETCETFDRHWASAVMQTALSKLRSECTARRGEEAFTVLGVFLGLDGNALSYEDASSRLGLSLAAFKTEVLTWRRKLREHLRAEVRKTVSAPHEIDEEMDYLRRLLAA